MSATASAVITVRLRGIRRNANAPPRPAYRGPPDPPTDSRDIFDAISRIRTISSADIKRRGANIRASRQHRRANEFARARARAPRRSLKPSDEVNTQLELSLGKGERREEKPTNRSSGFFPKLPALRISISPWERERESEQSGMEIVFK